MGRYLYNSSTNTLTPSTRVLINGIGNIALEVTCDSQFAGETISATKSSTTYTQICPSTSPYKVTFEGIEPGTWTISGTIQGTVFTTTVEVQDVSAVLSYGFVWTTWVDTASQLDSTDYNTLDELLEDEKAVRELMLEHACVDYLSSFSNVTPNLEKVIENDICAKWINLSDYALDTCYANASLKAVMDEADKYGYGEWVITDNTTTPPTWGPKGNVPMMTSDTAPYGTASAGSQYGTPYAAWKAFDGDASSIWAANHLVGTMGGTASDTIVYKSVNPIKVKALYFYHDANKVTTQLIVSGSNDGTNYDPIKTISNPSVGMVSVDSDTYYLYHKVAVTQSNVTDQSYALPQLFTLQFYGRELKDLVPPMISNTLPRGVAFASTEYSSSNAAYRAFDKSDSSGWLVLQGQSNNYIGYEFDKTSPIIMAKAKFNQFATSGQTLPARNFTLQASDDGISYGNALATFNVPAITGTTAVSEFTVSFNEQNKKYFRLFCPDVLYISGIGYVSVYELQLFGKDYSEKEFEAGATKKWLYDHGVELETLSISGIVGCYDSGTIKEPSQVYFPASNATSNSYGIITDSKIDLSAYSLLRIKNGNKGYNPDRYANLRVLNTKSANDNVADLLITVMNIVGCALDITSISQEKYILVLSGYSTRQYSMSELWLE